MKKIILFVLACEFFYFCSLAQLAIGSAIDPAFANNNIQAYAPLPFSEDFDATWINKNSTRDVPSAYWTSSPVTGNASWRRDDDAVAGSWTNALGTYSPAGANSTAHSARFHTYGTSYGTTGTLDVNLDFSSVGTKALKFSHIDPSGNDSLLVYLSTDNGTNFTLLQKFGRSATWVEHTIVLGASVSSTVVLRFKAKSDFGNDDIGLDAVQVYLQAASDMAAISWISPASGCGLSSSTPVTVRIANVGASSLSGIPVSYSINGGTGYVGPESIPGPLNPGDTINYTFSATANFSALGKYHCGFFINATNDQTHTNDSAFADVISLGQIQGFPFTENFNAGESNYVLLSADQNANAQFENNIGNQNTYGIHFTGLSNAGWPGTGTIPASTAWGTYTTHHATGATCNVNASSLTHLKMTFDLRQTYSYDPTNCWFIVVANGSDTLADVTGVKYFNPITASADAYSTKTYDLSAYAGTYFTLDFLSACKYNNANGYNGVGDNVYFDNLYFYIPAANDVGITSIIKPITKLCGKVSDSVTVVVSNFGTAAQSNIPVKIAISTPSGNTTLTGTLTGPLASNTADTLNVGFLNTTASGNYIFTAYTDLSTDNIFNNDTTLKMIIISSSLYIPHLEDFEGTTPLANWNTDFLTGAVHGNTSSVLYKNIYSSATTASAYMNKKVGPVTNDSYLTFDYRIINYSGGTATNLTTDSLIVLLSDDCGAVYDKIFTISSSNHVPSTSMKNIVVQLPSYAGAEVIPGFIIKRGTTGDYFLDIDNVAIISKTPEVHLGTDTLICQGDNIVLDAGAAPSGYTYTYNWYTLSHPGTIATSQTISVDSAATYIVVVTNGSGDFSADSITIGVTPCTGIDEINDFNFITLYPNPAHEQVTCSVYSIAATSVYIEISNYLGQNILNKSVDIEKGYTNIPFDISLLQNGVYSVIVFSSNGQIMKTKQLLIK